MKVVITKEEFRYFQTKVGEFIMKAPKDLGYWLNIYRAITTEIVTLENMGVDENTYSCSTAKLFFDWWEDLYNTWEEYMTSKIYYNRF